MSRRLAGGEDAFTLIEVVAASLIVAVITLATFAGFDVLTKSDADQRHHNEATVLAAQSQEALRSDPAAALNELVNTSHVYTQTVQGTKYTITQSAAFERGSSGVATCNASTEHGNETSTFVRVTSSVTWSGLSKTRPAVVETSIITPPVGSALEVDVTNGVGKPELNVPGVTVLSEGVETTTNENGCVIYNGIPATSTSVEAYKTGYVTKSGAFRFLAKEVSIAPNVITHVSLYLAQGGQIKAKFLYNNSPTWTRGSKVETVTGDDFVAFNNGLGPPSEIISGSTHFTYNGEGAYAATPTKYETVAETPHEPRYLTGDLFPFGNPYVTYAGDCTLNNPQKYGVALPASASATVLPGKVSTTTVPTSYDLVNLYKGTAGTPEGLTGQQYSVKITNLSCTSPTAPLPNDSYAATYEHFQTTTTEGHLPVPFQPFGRFSLCVYNETEKKSYTATYTNATVEGRTLNLFLKAPAGTTTEGTGNSEIQITVALNRSSC